MLYFFAILLSRLVVAVLALAFVIAGSVWCIAYAHARCWRFPVDEYLVR